MKLLNLVLYSNSSVEHQEGYEQMQEILNNYYSSFKNVDTIFYKYSEDLSSEYIMEGNIFKIKGTESLVPGVLEKTLITFEYIINNYDIDKYDYIIRSNISSIINFDKLIEELHENPIKFYGGAHIMDLNWCGGGITDSTWFGTLFVSGTSIILTKDCIRYIIANKHLLRMNIIDDLAIGILFREHRPDITPQTFRNPDASFIRTPCFYIQDKGFDLNSIKEYVKNNNIIVYRNRCSNHRKIDEIQMGIIVDILLNKI